MRSLYRHRRQTNTCTTAFILRSASRRGISTLAGFTVASMWPKGSSRSTVRIQRIQSLNCRSKPTASIRPMPSGMSTCGNQLAHSTDLFDCPFPSTHTPYSVDVFGHSSFPGGRGIFAATFVHVLTVQVLRFCRLCSRAKFNGTCWIAFSIEI